MPNPIVIAGRELSANQSPYIIAEVSANHNGSIERAKETILAAKHAGAHAVKIQTYTADTMTIESDNPDFFVNSGLWQGRSLYDLYCEAHTPFEWHEALFSYARSIGITLFSSPFDETAVDLLHNLDAPAYKIASFELVDLPLIAYIAKLKKPMLMSTGMASLDEIGEAIETARTHGCEQLAIFHCISSYPAPLDQANLRSIQTLQETFDVQVGLSDHTLGNTASIAATSLGATLIEKHFTLNRADGGVDSAFSIEPAELADMVVACEGAHSALGSHNGSRAASESANKNFRRSLYFVADLKQGEVIEAEHVRRIRPGFGIAPKYYDQLIGATATRDIKRGDRVLMSDLP
ncbi:MAG: pseudaminic acid synthase [Glaciecola sp.]